MEKYIQTLTEMEEKCRELRDETISRFFRSPSGDALDFFFCFTPLYQGLLRPIRGVIEVIDVFEIIHFEENIGLLKDTIHSLEHPELISRRKDFELEINVLINMFSSKSLKEKIRDRLSILNTEETSRLNEAVHCFLENCNYSSVAMSVSAIEFRLLSLMASINPDSKLERMTLGQLVDEYLKNKEKYGKVIPEKHEPLLEHCNTYRVFSVHPKKERISRSVATSILHMSFQFLLDKELLPKSEKNSSRHG